MHATGRISEDLRCDLFWHCGTGYATRNLVDNNHIFDGGKVYAAGIVSAERAATGKRSLKVNDHRALRPSWQPHFYYEPHITQGIVKQAFDVWIVPDTQFFTEWRDTSAYPLNVGPSVQFDGSGNVSIQAPR